MGLTVMVSVALGSSGIFVGEIVVEKFANYVTPGAVVVCNPKVTVVGSNDSTAEMSLCIFYVDSRYGAYTVVGTCGTVMPNS